MGEDADLLRRAHRVRVLLRAGADDHDPRSTPGLPREVRRQPGGAKEWSRAEVRRLGEHIGARQERLFARAKAGVDRRRVLLVLQSVDCGGKDGTVRSVVGAMNPLGVHLKAFGPPTDEERQQHYLWRVSRALPPAGYVGVFNRSHYEDVLVVRVHGLVPEKVWRRRFDEINEFEAGLVADGLTVIKVLLHISPEEQRARLSARLDDPTKRWKFSPDDLADRGRWAQFQQAYADVLRRCDTRAAPWYVVPADRKWYRNWAISTLIVEHLRRLDPQWPKADFDIEAEKARVAAS